MGNLRLQKGKENYKIQRNQQILQEIIKLNKSRTIPQTSKE